MARIVFFILLVLNLLAAAGLAGWLGGGSRRGEPERLTNQLRPEAIRLGAGAPPETAPATPPKPAPPEPVVPAQAVPPMPASQPVPHSEAPPSEPRACMQLVALSDVQAGELAALARAGSEQMEVADSASLVPSSWWVHMPPLTNRQSAEAKVAELRGLGISDLFILQEEGPYQYAISLGLFKTEPSANLHLTRLRNKGVVGAAIVARGATQHTMELRGPAEVLSGLASEIAGRYPDAERRHCDP